MNRKTFIQKSTTGLLFAVPAIALLGCSGSDDGTEPNPDPDPDPDPEASCLDNGTITAISANHGHELTVSKEDVEAGTAKTYTLSTGNGHTHQVDLTAAHFAQLQENNSVAVTSTSDAGHTHNVSVYCA